MGPQNLSGPKPVRPETCQKIPLRYTTHQLTNTAAKLSPTPHQKGRKSAPRLRSVNKSQNVFFCDSNCVTPDCGLDNVAYSTKTNATCFG